MSLHPVPLHPVPMCRQLIAEEEWQREGGAEIGDRLVWSNRACGIACLRMVLLTHGVPAPSVTALLRMGMDRGALISRGWVHAGLAQMGADLGVPGRAEPVAGHDLPARVATGPIIVSVTEGLPQDGRRGGHLIVLHGLSGTADAPQVHFRDPSRWGQDHDRVPLERLADSYTGRAIVFPALPTLSRSGPGAPPNQHRGDTL